MKRFFGIISIVLINSLLLLDICWAGNMDLSVIENPDTLAAPLLISEDTFLNIFEAQMSFVPVYGGVDDEQLTLAKINALLGKEEKQKAGNNKTNKLQSHYLAGLGALLFAKIADVQSFAAQNSGVVAIAAIGVITLIASGFLINRLLKNKRFVRRFIHPVHERWYIWRLGLDREKLIDMFIIHRIYSTDNRKELLNSINSWIRNIQNKEKNLADLAQLESDAILAKRLSEISAKLYSMGTDAGYFKALYWIYSNVYRVYYYKRVLKLANNKSYYNQEFFSRVRQGLNQSALINYYLKPTLRSTNPEFRRSTINILDKFVKAGLLAKAELIDIYLEVLEGPLSDVNTDAISGLINYIDGVDAQVKISLILKLQTIIQTQEKKIKKAQPLFRRVDNYSRQYDLQKQELLKVQALLIHIVMNVLADLENQSDLQTVIATAASLKDCFDLLDDDLYVQFKGYLNQILAILIEKQDPKNQRIKAQIKQTARQIKTVSELLKLLEQTRQKQLNLEAKQAGKSNGWVVSQLMAIAEITGKMMNNKKSAINLIEQGV